MPLLKKSSKGHSSQQKSGFKVPFADHKNKIKDIIDNRLNEPEIKKAYCTFIEELSQEKCENISLSPKEVRSQTDENKEIAYEKTKKISKKKKNNDYKIKSEDLDTSGSISQEDLNKGEIRAAYLEFMNNSLASEGSKKNSAFIYSSSEELFDDVIESFGTNSQKVDPKEKVTQTKEEKKTEKKSHEKQKPNDRKSPNEQLEKFMSKKVEVHRKTNLKTVTRGKATKDKSKRKTEKKTRKDRKPSNRDTQESTSDTEFLGLTDEEKMNKIYEKRNVGLYVLCDKCDKARYLPHVVDPLDLPETWFCYMNPDKEHNKCTDPEHVEESNDFLIDNLYNAGSIVFVKMDGYPWWPAMVEDDVDTETYFWLEGNSMSPTYYHVTFFDTAEVSRAWIRTEHIQPFVKNLKNPKFQISVRSPYKSRVNLAIKHALDAADMSLIDRLKTYGFLKRYKKSAKGDRNTKNKKDLNKKRREVSPFDMSCQDDMGEILENINISDLSFNFLE